MKKFAFTLALLVPILLSACSNGNDEFQGRFIAPDGGTSYEFLPANKLIIIDRDEVTEARYQYNQSQQTLSLTSEQPLPADSLTVTEAGNLKMNDTILERGVSYDMLTDSTWIGHEGDYTFSLTFNQTDKGMETYSELVTYYSEDQSYDLQTDDSITRLTGHTLLLDQTAYTVSDVSDNSLTLSIGPNTMIIEKHPKGTEIEFRDGYSNSDGS